MRKPSAKRALQALPGAKEPAYEVGYAKPPVHTRFQPGQSGNPRGRPKGARSKSRRLPALNEERMKTVVLEEAYRMIGIRDGERLVEIPVIQAVVRSIALTAAKGNQKSQRMFAELLQWVERENKALHNDWLSTAIDYKNGWDDELERRRRTGDTGPEPLPHPDDIVINMQTGLVEIRGPMTKEEKAIWDEARRCKIERRKAIIQLEKMAAKDPNNRAIADELKQERRLWAKITTVLPD